MLATHTIVAQRARRLIGLGAALWLLAVGPVPAQAAAIGSTALPIFPDGKPSVLLMAVPGVVKRGMIESDFLCTSLDSNPVDVGVEIFDINGNLLNDVHGGSGALLDLRPGGTGTIGTSGTAALVETTVISLSAFSQGFARIVGSSEHIRCNVLVLDNATDPPASITTLNEGARPTAGALLASVPLPTFSNGHRATHAILFPGIVKKARMQSNVFCTSLAAEAVDIGVEMLSVDGTVLNDVGAGNGAVVAVQPGATITFGTTGTAASLETQVISMPGVAQGVARVVTTSPDITCSAVIVDPTVAPPTAMSALFSGGRLTPGDVNQDGVINAADFPALVRGLFQ